MNEEEKLFYVNINNMIDNLKGLERTLCGECIYPPDTKELALPCIYLLEDELHRLKKNVKKLKR